VIKRVAASLALALLVLGCGNGPEPTPEDERVQLLTAYPSNGIPRTCFLSSPLGATLVVVDPKYGTAATAGDKLYPIGWPSGYTGWRFGSEVRVLNRAGQVVLVTGKRYEILRPADLNLADWPELPDGAFWSCGGGAIPRP
jgi:hypothetical protein